MEFFSASELVICLSRAVSTILASRKGANVCRGSIATCMAVISHVGSETFRQMLASSMSNLKILITTEQKIKTTY